MAQSFEDCIKKIMKRHLYVIASVQHHHHHHHHHISVMELGHLLTCSGLTYPEVSSKVYHDSFCQLGSTYLSNLIRDLLFIKNGGNAIQGLLVAILPLDLPCSGPITHSVEILTISKALQENILIESEQNVWGEEFKQVLGKN